MRQAANNSRKNSILLLSILLGIISSSAYGQATLQFSAPQPYVYIHGVETLLNFEVELDNPGFSAVSDISFSISMSDQVSLGNIDSECTESSDGFTRTISCEIDSLDAGAMKLIDFFVDGPNSVEAGPDFSVSLIATNVTVLEPNSFTASLADGDETVSGSNFTIHVIRDLNVDINQNTIPDVDESIINPTPDISFAEILATQASIDVLFLHTPAAEAYLEGMVLDRVNQYMTSTNQIFRENDVMLRLNTVGLEEIPYINADTSVDQTLSELVAKTDSAFAEFNSLVLSSGADIVVMMHALDFGSGTECTSATTNAIGRQGDFQQEYHQGELLSVINVGPDCLGFRHLATSMAANMGVVSDRINVVDGGTFSFSAGYELENEFSTLMVGQGGQPAPTAPGLLRFSNPAAICNNFACGVDREDLATGADAVNSLNRTRHVVSQLSATEFNFSALDRETILDGNGAEISISHSPTESGAIISDFAEFGVVITNDSSEALSDLVIAVSHLNDGAVSTEAQTYHIESDRCVILGPDLATEGTVLEGITEKAGQLECLINQMNPGEEIFFNYSIQIDDSPPMLDTESYYHQLVSVNNIYKAESETCIPVFTDIVDAQAGSTVCDDVENLVLDVGIGGEIDLDALPVVSGSNISIPFLRIFDGQLISGEFDISSFSPLQLTLVSYQLLDQELLPAVESDFAEDGTLTLLEITIDDVTYTITATYQDGTDPGVFDNLLITPI